MLRADENDVPVATQMLLEAQASGAWRKPRVAQDRGFSQQTAQLNRLRDAGINVTFDLKSDQQGFVTYVKGCLLIDGWLYLPSGMEPPWIGGSAGYQP